LCLASFPIRLGSLLQARQNATVKHPLSSANFALFRTTIPFHSCVYTHALEGIAQTHSLPRSYGMAKFAQKGATQKTLAATGDKLAEDGMRQMTEQMKIFKERLEAFAMK